MDRRLSLAFIAAGATAWAFGLQAGVAVEPRPVSGFDAVDWQASGELSIEQTGRERLTVEAEPSVLPQLITEVRGRRLVIAAKPGSRIESRETIRFRLEVKTLSALSSTGSGAVRIGPLSAEHLVLHLAGSDDVHLARLTARTLQAQLLGAGELRIDAGAVQQQRVHIGGAANHLAPRLASRHADVTLEGGGRVDVAVSDHLAVRLSGSGEVLYRGQPRVVQDITGAGEVRRASD